MTQDARTADAVIPEGPAPVSEGLRSQGVDVLRGFALLGILTMNIIAFAYPGEVYMDAMSPAILAVTGAFEGLNRAVWWAVHLLADQKMMSIFSMLFGAGLVLMDARSRARRSGVAVEEPGGSSPGFAGLYYRRLGWLFLFGLVHAYLIWYGDILVAYALCGLVLYPLRKARPAVLIPVGAIVMLVALPICSGVGFVTSLFMEGARDAQSTLDGGGTLSPDQQRTLDEWNKAAAQFELTAESVGQTVDQVRSGFSGTFAYNAKSAAIMQTVFFLLWSGWRAAGLMLVGMGLMKLGVFSAQRSTRFYTTLMLLGYGLGLPLVAYGGTRLIASEFDAAQFFLINGHFNYVGSLGVALGHVGLVMLVVKFGVLKGLAARLAAVGRMAFTNYLAQSLICTAIFYGWGLGLFAGFERAELYLFVLGVWILQLLWSPWWLARFKFGPAEWVWRSLTYWERQPMRRRAKPAG